MRSYLDAVLAHCIVNELLVFGGEAVQASLDHMVAVQILDECHHIRGQGHHDSVNLEVNSRAVKS